LRRYLPWLLGIGLTVAAAAGGIGTSVAMRRALALPEGADVPEVAASADDASSEPSPSAPARTASKATRPTPGLTKRQYVDDILARNIFDADAIGKTATGDLGDGEAALTDLNVHLIGTIVAVPDRYSSALIAEEGKDVPKAYGIGDKLYDAEVIKIEEDQVQIRRGNGNVEVIALEDDQGSKHTVTRTASTSSDEEGIDQVGDNKFVLDRNLVDKYMTNLDALARMGRAIPHRGADGQIDGYRLSGIRRNSLGQKIGIKNGDIVHAVNGHPLTSMQGAMAAYQALQSDSSFSFEVTRRGQRMNLEYEVR